MCLYFFNAFTSVDILLPFIIKNQILWSAYYLKYKVVLFFAFIYLNKAGGV